MNKEIKAQWIDALLSGEYKQGRGALRNSKDEYCCLGVLCDLYSKDTGVEWGVGLWWDSPIMHGLGGMTSNEVDHWAGFTASPGYDPREDDDIYTTLSYLVELNDNGKTFEQIAEYIEEKL